MGIWTILPPILAIIIAMWKREVILSLVVAIFCSEVLIHGFNVGLGFLGTLERITAVFEDSANTRILLFSLLIGALLSLVRHSGGVAGFVNWLIGKKWVETPRQVGLLTATTGVLIFIETNLSILTAGILSQNLFDHFKMSRARLAYIIDSTCAPVSVLLLLNAWGAYILGLLNGYGLKNPVQTMLYSIPLNIYAITTLVLVFFTAWSNRVFFSMATQERTQAPLKYDADEIEATQSRFFILPIFLLIASIIGFMFYTGHGNLIEGSGSKAVLWSTALALLFSYILLQSHKRFDHQQLMKLSFKGMAELLPLVSTVLLALALGASMKALGTGTFVASIVSDSMPNWLIAPAIFLTASIISFSTGTSWGTFGILIPIAIPIAMTTGLAPSLLLAAVLGGGVFGDHCSPISDTTIIASLAAGCDHLDHVKTQLPYALLAALVSLVTYVLLSLG